MLKTTDSFDLLKSWIDIFKELYLPVDVNELLNNGNVLYVVRMDGDGMPCWPYFPVGKHRKVVQGLQNEGIEVSRKVKVIMEIDGTNDADIRKYALDCLGHVIQYLRNPKDSNECEDAARVIKRLGIFFTE